MAELGFELFLRFLWGSMLIIFWISRKETSERFLKVAFWIAFGCCTAAAAMAYSAWLVTETSGDAAMMQKAWFSMSGLMAGMLCYSFFTSRTMRTLGFLFAMLAPLFVLDPLDNPRGSINFVTSAFLMGSVFTGQFLGHWYLTVANLHIKELSRVVKMMLAAVLIKAAEVLYTLFFTIGYQPKLYDLGFNGRPLGIVLDGSQALETLSLSDGLFAMQGDVAFGLGAYGVLLLVTRVLWGVLAPALLSGMVYQTVQIRSTQSATGILYAICVMIIIGEGAALYFKNTLGIHL